MNPFQHAFGSISGGRVLDVATGNGNFVGVVSEYLRDYVEIVGIDTNSRALDTAREHFKQANIHFESMDAARLEFSNASFDTICMAYSLHHLAHLPPAFAEMRRVLKPGGTFIVAEMYRDNQTATQLSHVYLHHWCAAIDTALGVSHRETYTRQQILDLVCGLALHDCQFYDYADVTDDPQDAPTIQRLNAALDQYCERAQHLPNAQELRARSDELRARLQTIGYHSATILIAVGRK